MSLVKKNTNKTVNVFPRILPKNFISTTKTVKSAVKKGWSDGRVISEINNKGLISDFFIRTKCISNEIKNMNIKDKDIPILAAALGYIAPIPIPGLTIYAYLITLAAVKINKKLHK